jgi:hypothetical protein
MLRSMQMGLTYSLYARRQECLQILLAFGTKTRCPCVESSTIPNRSIWRIRSIYPMKTTNVKQSKKNSGWFLAIPHEDEKGFEALAYLRKNGYFNTPLFRLNKNKSQKQITRYYLRFPHGREIIRTQHYRNLQQTQQEHKRLKRKLEQENELLKRRVAQLETENASLRADGLLNHLHDYDDIVDILESGEYGAWIKVENNDEHPSPKNPNLNFVTPDMSATLGRGTHVMIDIDKVPKDLQVLLAKMMDALNDHTLRISRLENC